MSGTDNLSKLSMMILILAFILPLASAGHIRNMYIEDRVMSDDSLHEELNIYLINNTEELFTLRLPPGARDIFINNEPVTEISQDLETNISCRDCIVKVTYILDNVIARQSINDRIYSRTLNLPHSPDFLSYSVILPEGNFVLNESPEPSIVPSPDLITTDGKNIRIHWKYDQPETLQRYFIRFHKSDFLHTPAEEILDEFGEWAVWVLLFIAVSIGILAGSLYHRRICKMKKQEFIIPDNVFSTDEKAVLTVIKEHESSKGIFGQTSKPINQKDIAKRLQWSKSKVSGVIHNLEFKKVIRREKVGRSYLVYLDGKVEANSETGQQFQEERQDP